MMVPQSMLLVFSSGTSRPVLSSGAACKRLSAYRNRFMKEAKNECGWRGHRKRDNTIIITRTRFDKGGENKWCESNATGASSTTRLEKILGTLNCGTL
ncbi:hypothetical protein N657DRAFT_177132 [Parathielavia appendiculata]|uniref:Uncharacterized protein n=1 Tax=Parathielavia appendiculata TaxID=2587402 RepID=A0AAN6Z782_9PEZI|nr:hypothetical protein N657DRAFT_177132 [Parathielavia appendiculata]